MAEWIKALKRFCVTLTLLCLNVAPIAASAQSPAAVEPQGAEQTANEKYKVLDGIPYRTIGGETLLCDLYVPSTVRPLPAVLFLHGGGWSAGDRKQLRRQAAYLAERGFFGMAIDYRLAPAHPFPAALEDAHAAVAWLRTHAGEYNLDSTRLAVVGSSAGGNLAALLGVASGPHAVPGTSVNAVVAFNGIYDLATMPATDMISRFLGAPCIEAADSCREASPQKQVGPGAPPFLLLHGTADKTAPYSQATAMIAALHAAHDTAELFTANGAPHTFWAQPQWIDPTFRKMLAFLTQELHIAPVR